MAEQGSFIQMVRRGRIAPPTTRSFTPAAWTASYEASRTCEADDALHEAGLWFYSALQLRWQRIANIDFQGQPLEQASRDIAIVANAMHMRTQAQLAMAMMAADDDSRAGSTADLRLGDADRAATADMIRTSGIDTLGKAVQLLRTGSRRTTSVRFDPQVMLDAYPIFQDLYLLEFAWGRVVWLGWAMGIRESEIEFVEVDGDVASTSFVISNWRREHLLTEFHGIYAQEWRAENSALPAAWTVAVRKREGHYAFKASRRSPGDGEVPIYYVLRELLSTGELAPYFDRPLPLVPGSAVTLGDVIEAWDLLAQASQALTRLLFKLGPDSRPRLAPAVRVADLIALLQILGWSQEKSATMVRFFTYEQESLDGLWTKPLIPIPGGRVLLILTPLAVPNLLRVAELWATEGAGDRLFAERGTDFETKLRREIAGPLRQRSWSAEAFVLVESWEPKIGKKRRDIDLVIRIGRVVFIGEIKLKKHPNSAAEIGRHLAEFEHAAEQLDFRLPYLREHRRELCERTNYSGSPEDLKVVGFIVSGNSFGSGTTAGGYPVVDHDALTFFFENDEFLISATADRETGYAGKATAPNHSIRLVDEDPASCLLAYIRNPLHVRFAEVGLLKTTRRNSLTMSNEDLLWPEHHIDSEQLSPARADAVSSRLSADWRRWKQVARDQISSS